MSVLQPVRSEVKAGHWVVLRNRWLVGPVLPASEDFVDSIFVRSSSAGRWEVYTRDDQDIPWDDARRVVFSGTRDEAATYWNQCQLADEIIAELIDETI